MNRLQLCQRTRQEAGAAGTGPVTTIAQTAELKSIVDWVDSAYEAIQSEHPHWSFLWEQASITILAAASSAANTIPAGRYVTTSARVSATQWLPFLRWRDFADRYPVPAAGVPSAWSIRPDQLLVVNAIPAADFTFTVERYKVPQVMVADTDVPVLPTEHHLAIVWRAVMLYYGHDEAGVSYRLAKKEFDPLMARLLSQCTPEVTFGAPLL